jgi:hypothetical protein
MEIASDARAESGSRHGREGGGGYKEQGFDVGRLMGRGHAVHQRSAKRRLIDAAQIESSHQQRSNNALRCSLFSLRPTQLDYCRSPNRIYAPCRRRPGRPQTITAERAAPCAQWRRSNLLCMTSWTYRSQLSMLGKATVNRMMFVHIYI